MKLIIRDKAPEESEGIIEVWLEYFKGGGGVSLVTQYSSSGIRRVEINLHPDLTFTQIPHGNFSRNPVKDREGER